MTDAAAVVPVAVGLRLQRPLEASSALRLQLLGVLLPVDENRFRHKSVDVLPDDVTQEVNGVDEQQVL